MYRLFCPIRAEFDYCERVLRLAVLQNNQRIFPTILFANGLSDSDKNEQLFLTLQLRYQRGYRKKVKG